MVALGNRTLIDLAALRVLTARMVRPADAPVILMGDGLGAQLALRALSQGLPGVDGAVLGDPMLKPRSLALPVVLDGQVAAEWIAKAGLGRAPAPGERGWREDDARGRGRWAAAPGVPSARRWRPARRGRPRAPGGGRR